MAEELPYRSERFSIDRRRLLKTSVAITAVNFAPDLAPSETASVVSVQSVSTASEGILNVCATTARRIAEIRRRNETRREAKLDLLPIAKELRRMKEQDDSQKFSEAFGQFAAKHRQAVWNEVLKSRRELEGPNWWPSWITGMGYQGEVFRILREHLRRKRRITKSRSRFKSEKLDRRIRLRQVTSADS
jgi:hypothetical protein